MLDLLSPTKSRLPRTRGGLPTVAAMRNAQSSFASHTRGSTAVPYIAVDFLNVCPAHAGVYPSALRRGWR